MYVYKPDAHFPDVTRVTVVSEEYRVLFEKFDLYKCGVDILIQDNGRTLKIVPKMKLEGLND